MLQDQALDQAKYLKELFPFATDAQCSLLAEDFLKYEVPQVREAIKEHARRFNKLDIPALLYLVRGTDRRTMLLNLADDAACQVRKRQEKDNEREDRAYAAKTQGLDLAQIAALAERAIAMEPEPGRALLLGKDPSRCRTLRRNILKILENKLTSSA